MDKGKQGEREWAKWLRDNLGVEAHRGRQYKGSPDSPDVVSPLPIHWEVKRTERLRIYEAVEQAVEESKEDEVPIVAYRANRREWLLILRARDLPRLKKALKRLRARSTE